jgi:hypothetical protein
VCAVVMLLLFCYIHAVAVKSHEALCKTSGIINMACNESQ